MNDSKFKVTETKYSIGDLIHHKLFNYRGVVFDIDPCFQLTDEWYETVAQSRPPKDEPWYHVLVHGAVNTTYVAEQHLELDLSGKKINHPMTNQFFTSLEDGKYVNDERFN